MGAAHALVVAGLAILTGCSLALEELKSRCETNDDCHPLNVAHGLDDAQGGDCRIYQCRQDKAGCELSDRDFDNDHYIAADCRGSQPGDDCDDSAYHIHPNADESCDGQDNDCDDWIDEHVVEGSLEAPAQFSLDPPEIVHVSYSDPSDGAWWALTGQSGDSFTTRLFSPQPADPSFTPLGDGERTCSGRGCTMLDVAIASAEELLLAVGVDAALCRPGQVRIGVAVNPSAPSLTWNGLCGTCASDLLAMTSSNLGTTVDLDATSRCSASGVQRGASSPSIAVLPDPKGRPNQALALWRAGPDTSAALPLVGMPLVLDRLVPNQGRVISVNAPGGRSSPFDGNGSEGRSPAVIRPWSGGGRSGYLVAYDSQAGVELAFVPGDVSTDFAEVARLPIRSPGVRQVALARMDDRLTSGDFGSELALAWRTDDAVYLARVMFATNARQPFTLQTCGLVREGASVRDGPGLTYRAQGFGVGEKQDGFFVSWIEGSDSAQQLMGARVSRSVTTGPQDCAEELATIEPPFQLWSDASIEHLFAFGDDDGSRYAFITKQPAQRLNIGSLRCR